MRGFFGVEKAFVCFHEFIKSIHKESLEQIKNKLNSPLFDRPSPHEHNANYVNSYNV